MPRPPSWINQANAIIKYFENPCDAPWAIYFETALPALGSAILVLLDFGFDDVVRGALRPRGLRKNRHMRRGRRGRRGGAGIPEIGELIGAALPGAKTAKGRFVTQGVKNLWLVDGVIQRILWWWLVADVSINFFYNWTSAIQESEFCSAQGVGAALYKSQDDDFIFSVANAWTSLHTSVEEYETGSARAKFGAHSNGGLPFSATLSMQYRPWPALPNGTIEIQQSIGGDVELVLEETIDKDGFHNIVANTNSPSSTVTFRYRTNGGAFEGVSTSFTMGQ